MQQKSKSKKHTQSIGGFLSPLWFPIPVPNPVWERFSFCFFFAFHLHFFRFFFKKWGNHGKKMGNKWEKNGEKMRKKSKKNANPINFALFSLSFLHFPQRFGTSLLEPSQAQPRAGQSSAVPLPSSFAFFVAFFGCFLFLFHLLLFCFLFFLPLECCFFCCF